MSGATAEGEAAVAAGAAGTVEEVPVELGDRSYGILIGEGVLDRAGARLREIGLSGRICLVSTPPVFDLYGATVEKTFREAGFDVVVASIPDGEDSKSLGRAEALYDVALKAGLDRTSTFAALGGGVVGDLTGFIAATYMRGVSFVQIPTTLLSQVDSSVGGKVAVNHPLGKNMIGAFHQPRAVFIDTATLRTLPERDYLAGVAEIIRYGAALDERFFSFLEKNMERLVARDTEVLRRSIATSCSIKARIVAADERETSGLRSSLNYGHTFAHALEAVTDYGVYRHGEAVAIGMVYAARLASRLGICPDEAAQRIEDLIVSAGLPTSMAGYRPADIISAMAQDKKTEGGKLRFVLTEKVGSVNIYTDISNDILEEVLSRE